MDPTPTSAPDPVSPSTPFFSWWRPWIGWVLGMAFSLQFVVFPLLAAWLWLARNGPKPDISFEHLMTLTGTALTWGGMRSWEKHRGIAR